VNQYLDIRSLNLKRWIAVIYENIGIKPDANERIKLLKYKWQWGRKAGF
jgi:hypothetical protein